MIQTDADQNSLSQGLAFHCLFVCLSISLFVCVSVCYLLQCSSRLFPCLVTSGDDDDDELRLVTDLFSGYNKNVRPVEDKSLPIEVKFGIAYTQIVDLVGDIV